MSFLITNRENAQATSTTFLSPAVQNMLLATFFFALMNVFVKNLTHIPAMEIVFFRCLVSAAICFFGIHRERVDWRGSNRTLLVLRGTFGTAALYTFFLTLHNVPLATAMTIQYLSPIFTTVIAVVWLKERVRRIQWLFFLLAFGGVFVVKGFDARISFAALAVGVFSAVCSGTAYALVRGLKAREHPLVVVLHFQLIGLLIGLLFSLFCWVTPTGWDWIALLIIGILTQLGQLHLTKSLHGGQIASVSVLSYSGLLYALGFGFFLFGEIYTVQTLVGILLVVAGVVLSVWFGRKQSEMIDENTIS